MFNRGNFPYRNTTSIRTDFLSHLYNFAADEFGNIEPVGPLNPPDPVLYPQERDEILQAKPQDFKPDAFLPGHPSESDQPPSCADLTRDEIRQSFELFPLLSEAISHLPDRSSRRVSVSNIQFSQRQGMTSIPQAVPIAPLHTRDTGAKEKAIESAMNEEAGSAKELELRALRAYHRKIRNRESAARSNLARKRRRELQRMELAKKQRIFQGELAPAVS